MIRVNIHEAKTHFLKLAKKVKAGETILRYERNKPFAEIRALAMAPKPKKECLANFADKSN